MKKFDQYKLKIVVALFLIPTLVFLPHSVPGEVAPIEETQEMLENISQEELQVLEELYAIAQKIDALEQEEVRMNVEIVSLQEQITQLEAGIEEKQKDYDLKLTTLEQVLVFYQRGGPASYLEILLRADSLTTFLKSINVIKDISKNVGELLLTLEEEKKVLQEDKDVVDEKLLLLDTNRLALQGNIHNQEVLLQEQEQYLASLLEDRVFYEEQLINLELLWEDSKVLFTDIVAEITRIIGEGYFTVEDLNMNFGLFEMQGAIEEETFNNILMANSELPDTTFYFNEGDIIIEVPEKHLVLHGEFVIAGDSAIQYEVTSGTFYELPLDDVSILELFEKGPLLIDFTKITGDMVIIDFTLQQVESQTGRLAFEIKLEW